MLAIQRVLSALMILFLLASCAKTMRLPPLEGEKAGMADTAAVLGKLQETSTRLRSYRGLSRTTFEHEGTLETTRQALQHVLLFKKPGHLRIETLPLDAMYSLNILVAGPAGALYLDPVEKRAVRAKDADRLLISELQLPLRAEDLASFMAGRVPESLLGTEHVPDWNIHFSEGTVQAVTRDWGYFLILDRSTLQLRKVEIRYDRRLTVAIQLEDYRETPEGQFPHRIDLELPKQSVRLKMEMRKLNVNQELAPSLFQARVPGAYPVEWR